MPILPSDEIMPVEYPLEPDAMKLLADRDLSAVVESFAPLCALIHDADGEPVVRVRREIHPSDLATLLDFGRRRFEAGKIFGADELAAKFRALLEPRPRDRG